MKDVRPIQKLRRYKPQNHIQKKPFTSIGDIIRNRKSISFIIHNRKRNKPKAQ